MIKLGAKELRVSRPTAGHLAQVSKNELYIILDNVLDTYNVGAIFRLADAVGAKKVYLCGQTETPPNSRIKKASINTTEWVDWEYAVSAIDAINDVRSKIKDIQIVSIEQNVKSIPYNKISYHFP